MFQNYALYPHFRVRGNIAFYFPPTPLGQCGHRYQSAGNLAPDGHWLRPAPRAFPPSLSGGEKQRVALARCLSHSPRVLLLDEPFSNLDATLRLQTRGEVKRLIGLFGLTTVFVTHDQNEAVAMGHRVAVMRQGQIEQVGTYQEIYREPVNAFVAGFLGNPPMHLVAGRRMGNDIVCEVSGTQVRLPLPVHYRPRVADGEPVTIGLRPEHLRLTGTGETPGLPCIVEMVEMSVSDAAHILHLRHNDYTFCAKAELQQPVRPRETVWLHFPPQHIYYFDRDDKRL